MERRASRQWWRGLRAAGLVAWVAVTAGAQELPGLGGAEPDATAPPRTIAAEHSPAEDQAVAKRLGEIYAEVEGLDAVEVEVTAGVVRLSGEVLSSGAREKALRIAGQLQGVVEVQDEITESQDLERRLRPMFEDLADRGRELAGQLPLLLVSVAVFVLFWMIGRLLTAWEAPFRRLAHSEFARDLLRQALRVAFVVAGLIVALEVLDATAVVAAVAGAAGLAGLALSFAFRDLTENYISSVLLSLRQPFLAGEHVVIDGNEGHVVRLTSRATILMNPDGNHVRIPNAAVYKGTILNYSRNPERRFGFEVGVASDTELAAAVGLGLETLGAIPGVLADPSPQGWVESLADWSVVLRFHGWVDQREVDFAKARGEAMRRVKEAFDAAGIVMPEPTVRTLASEPAAARPELPGAAEEPVDLSPDSQIEDAVAADRAAAGDGLLDDSRATE